MITALGVVAFLLTLALAPFFGYLALVTLAALWRGRTTVPPPTGKTTPPPRFLVVIPAHDEEANVAATVASCRSAAYDPDAYKVVVIADNCSDGDDTAAAAEAAGALVFVRHDPGRRSKGYALEWLLDRLAASREAGPFDAVVVVDADSVVDPNLLATFAEALDHGVDWAQCYYTVRNPEASWRTRLLTYAFALFNGVWLLGQDALGRSVGFRGNGMLFSTKGLARVPWRSYGLVEDQEFSWTLRLLGERVHFLSGARVYAEMVSRGSAAVSQRRRWEEGRRSLRAKNRGPLLSSPSIPLVEKALALVELEFPPLTTLATLLIVAATFLPLAWTLGGPSALRLAAALAPLQGLMALSLLAYAASPFFAMGLPLRYATSLAALPYFALWKALATFRARSKSWVRTEREATTRADGADRGDVAA